MQDQNPAQEPMQDQMSVHTALLPAIPSQTVVQRSLIRMHNLLTAAHFAAIVAVLGLNFVDKQ